MKFLKNTSLTARPKTAKSRKSDAPTLSQTEACLRLIILSEYSLPKASVSSRQKDEDGNWKPGQGFGRDELPQTGADEW